jgi:glycosyltransferase involved in cell wall biosynthesis
MKIAIDALGITQPGGGRTATLNLLQALLRLDHDNDYLILVDVEEPALAGPNVRQWAIGERGRFAARLWVQWHLPTALRRERVALVHHVKNLGAFFMPGRTVVTVYDLSVLIHPEIYPRSDRLYWRWVEPLTLRQADCVIAISNDTADAIARYYGLLRQRIRVIYPGYDPRFRPLPDPAAARAARQYGLPDTFFLHVGSISRKKNLLPVVQAVARLRQSGHVVKLVLVGRVYGKARDDELLRAFESGDLEDDVMWLGPVPDDDLPALYNAAVALVFPSLQEGFGLVPLEAMACGLPVVTSGAGAIGEVVGDAAFIVDHASEESAWASALERVLSDSGLRQRLRSRGLERVPRFSNEESARQLLEVYRELSHSGSGRPT